MSPTDFNDLHAAEGLKQVAKLVQAAAVEGPDEEDLPLLAPPSMPREAFPELVRAIVDAACTTSEAHPVAVAANVLTLFCAAIGRVPYQRIGDAVIHARPFALIVGKSGKARKGTSEHTAREIFRRAFKLRTKNAPALRIHAGGLSTGEGIGYAIRDPKEPDEKTGKGADGGVKDKRLLVIEPEFANVLAQLKRDGNTLSATIRNLFDGRDIEPLTKTSQVTATRPHVVITGHITAHELREKSTTNDAVNGLLNRFMVLHVYRPRLVPLPKPTDEAVLDGLAQKVADAIEYATGGDPLGEQSREVILTPEAERAWCEIYPQVTRDREGLAGSLMARSEMYCRLLAMVFALMDARSEIEPADLVQAVAWIEYWQQSVSYVFMTAEPEHELDTFETEVLMLIRARPGLKLSEVQDHWSRQKQDEVKAALTRLLELAPPLVEMQIDKPSRGRPAQRYFPASAHESDKSEKSQITNEKMGEKRVRKG